MTNEKRFVMIENQGTVGTDLLTIIGASTARHQDNMIGQFGSGFKYSIALLLRHKIDFKLFIGKQGYEFGSDERTSQDVRSRDVTIAEVYMKGFSGPSKAKQKLGFDRGFGEMDWRHPRMACREFMSNAADASMTLQGDYKGCRILYKDESSVKGEDGVTRVFIELTPSVEEWAKELSLNFMIFDKGYDSSETIVTKRVPMSNIRIFRKGVLVGTFPFRSLFDYNLNEIHVNESREISQTDAREAIGRALKDAPQEFIEQWLEAVRDHKDVFEVLQVASWSLQLYEGDDNYQERLTTWTAAFRSVFTDSGVLCDTDYAAEGVRRKGYNPVVVPTTLKRTLASFELPTSGDLLDHFESLGREKYVPDTDQMDKIVSVWDALVEMGVTKDRGMPEIEGFRTVMDAGGTTFAYYDQSRDVVGMSADVLSDGGFTFIKFAIEEFAHSITKSADETRDLQDYAFKVAAILLDRFLSSKKKKK